MDWNGDGYDDVIVGDRDGFVNYYRRLPSGNLTAEPRILCAGATIDVGYNAAPDVVDLNGDGFLDLIIGDQGTSTGTLPSLRLYLNDGAGGAPEFSSFSYIQSNGSDISLYRNNPRLIDFDQDGDRDLYCGTCIPALVYYYENTGTSQAPVFAEPDTVFYMSDPITGPAGIKIFCTDVDLDYDNTPDIFVSDYYGLVDLYLSDVVGLSDELNSPLGPTDGVLSISGSPTSGQFLVHLSLPQASEISLLAYGIDGRVCSLLLTENVASGQHSFVCDLSNRPAGVYTLVMQSSDGSSGTGRIVLLGH